MVLKMKQVFDKQAQMDFDGISVPVQELDTRFPSKNTDFPSNDDILEVMDENYDFDLEDEELEVELEEVPAEFSFELPTFPGAEDQNELDLPDIEVEEDEDAANPWKWTHENFEQWFKEMLQSVPKHSGQDVLGCERAIGYMEAVLKEAPKALRTDIHGIINATNVERMKDESFAALKRLYQRLEELEGKKYPKKLKKSSEQKDDLTKEAGTAHINGITITVPMLISTICRIAINSAVSHGKDIEHIFNKLSKDYNLDKRESLEAMQLLSDMGWPMQNNWDRLVMKDEERDYTSEENEMSPNYGS
jgi:hypothetical protein